MPKRIWIFALAAAAVLMALFIALYAGLLNTDAGRRMVLDALQPSLERSLGGEVRIGGTAGTWPHHIVLRDVTIADEKGVWLRIDELSMHWKPLALVSGRIRVGELAVPGGTLIRLPEPAEEEPGPPGVPHLPRLPDLEIGSLTVGTLNVKSAAAGRETVLHLDGTASMRADLLRLTLEAATEGEKADRADMNVDWNPAGNHLSADVRIAGPEGGLITRLLGVDHGRVSISVSGTGPASGWQGAVGAEAGSYGSLYGNLACECLQNPKFDLKLDAVPGPALPADLRRYLGKNPRLEAMLYSPEKAAWTLLVRTLDIAAVELAEPLRIALTESGRLLRFDVSAGLVPGPALKDAVPAWLGDSFRISARGGFPAAGGVRLARMLADSQAAELDLENIALTPGGRLDGIGKLRLRPAGDLPETVSNLTGNEARLGFSLEGDTDEFIRLEDTVLETEAGTAAQGVIAYGPASRTLRAALNLTLPASVFASLTGAAEPAGPVTGRLSAAGTLAELSATLKVQTPELELEPRALPPAETILNLSGGLDDPQGKVTVRRLDDEKKPLLLSADFSWPQRKTLNVTGLKLAIDGAQLDGEAQFAADTGRLTGKAKLKVPDLAALAAQASGSLTADIALTRQGEDGLAIDVTAMSPLLVWGGYEAEELKASASGPLGKLTVTADATRIRMPGAGPLRDFKLAAGADLTEAAVVTVNKLSAMVNGTALSLTEPASIKAADDTTEISNVKLSWGDSGSIRAAALLSPERLKADLEMAKAPIPGQPALVSGSVKVDTEEAQPGSLDLRLDPADGPKAALQLTGTWNGQRLDMRGNLTGAGTGSGRIGGEMLSASMPLTLERSDGGFSVSTEGPLEGRLAYKGKLEPLMSIFLTPAERDLTGVLDADFRIGGTLAAPSVNGSAVLNQGRYEEGDTGLLLTAINARLNIAGGTEGALGTLKLTAWDKEKPGRGSPPVTGEGRVVLNPDGLGVTADIALRKATLVQKKDLSATFSGDASLSGTLPRLAVTGDIRIDRLDLLIPDEPEGVVDVPVVLVDKQGVPLDPELRKKEEKEAKEGESGEDEGEFAVALDLKLRSDGQAFVRGRGLDSEWKADLFVGGTIEQPKLNGSLTLKKGTFNFAGRRFDVSKGEVTFTGQTPPDPALDIAAEYETEEDVKAIVKVSGRTSEPSVELESEPPLPKEQVMSTVLFGKPATELTALQALQVTQSVAQLTGTGPFGGGSIMDRARRTLGLDLLDLTFGKENGEVGLTVGRYLSEGVFVSATQDVSGQGGKVSVEVEVTDEFSVQTDVGQDASGGVSAQWKKDY